MSVAIAREELRQLVTTARDRILADLLATRSPAGNWVGELSTSALSTATAIMALTMVQRHHPQHPDYSRWIQQGRDWLIANQNADGGWGDTVRNSSNISTSMLVWAALTVSLSDFPTTSTYRQLQQYLHHNYGKTPAELADSIRKRYGKDHTFSVPILTMCALAGLVDWREVPRLPFELACLPQSWYRFARLPVVSYALPALIAIGQCIHTHRGHWNPMMRVLRSLARKPSLTVLRRIQPESGGYLEAAPLTSFVSMSLASIGQADHPVVKAGIQFLLDGVREDGSWPIDTNLSIWVTTLSIQAIVQADAWEQVPNRDALREWLISQQTQTQHPFTGAAPGAWGWSDLSGSVPDADDTPGALIALAKIGNLAEALPRAREGIRWLCDLQNRDGGWPTFCKGWGLLPFDRSGADLTAHAIRAFVIWQPHLNADDPLIPRMQRAISAGFRYLQSQQRADGSWLPLWFGNQHSATEDNPTYGTARVLAAYRDAGRTGEAAAQTGAKWLHSLQNRDGGWGGDAHTPSSVEETALAVEALMAMDDAAWNPAIERGLTYLAQRIHEGAHLTATPIGFYFAKLWYFEQCYPLTFGLSALGSGVRWLNR
ncbi:prenyltransferase/squalene oxidase repeat-containing protein [Tuwongella immobilis]|uniref:Squalene cyclase C-terminal domain-containing protein n=1 Tax=Tuwongella immobilis TaxID=692036 RepID=A0A6C2YU62_9BACT|nr:prenyltransferase/squalene oxidase repeat-containing protein [Tuwongella immobilis]VIP04673.1 squalene-hopene cyclase : Probable squalene-hopene cyclase OS=Planctomyces maris DSM 8797 GN=PM8797T_19949 PE=4 SV=1: Prenyltrans_1: Prenyltrans_2 [Tuwongella immobilis]VTS06705.1 squalene-hopene cyclase : Probable squalene-hopene cyclase OS=Planctomyces maris DSM 8797 GN=PM8797T_19949 PE=4 SV=1: Prenyltrans_1: Prenyltrans_2 [Tuwongella immobilis]